MSRVIVLDSTPLALFLQRRSYLRAAECSDWVARHINAGDRFIVPEIIDYEVRRELLRLGKTGAIRRLDLFNRAEPDRLLPVSSDALRKAAELWAQVRRKGMPTADIHALDVDVILAAQVLTTDFGSDDVIVATGNVSHLSPIIRADQWDRI